ncbi:MAG: thiamine phosphate synthase [Clostridia bacterium]|nr:thiamine phosphate synthase [Clostridia bacterium]MDE7328808.1 thiamine phosphate synthase [Clostridia bacterium]
MFDLFCVTNRNLCQDDFLKRLDVIAQNLDCGGIILREKDLSESEYESLAKEVISICKKRGTVCILHNFIDVAAKLKCDGIHLPLNKLFELSEEQKRAFKYIGASCHSLQDVLAAQNAGCSYVSLGHIFATDCKKGLSPKGVDFLQEVCANASIPVYAIGGISQHNIKSIMQAKANGACVMSGFMQCDDAAEYTKRLTREINAK